jgi:hypothetical protein
MLVTLTVVAPVRAQSPLPSAQPSPVSAPTDEDRRMAHEEYERGKVAFEAKDYLQAARLFLSAYARAPHHDPLWNAARAFELAGEKVRAANLYTLYLELAPSDARDRARATETRKELAASLGRLDIQGRAEKITVDDQPASLSSVYVDPGQHIVRGRVDGQPVETLATVAAGATLSVALQGPPGHAPAILPVAPPNGGETQGTVPSDGSALASSSVTSRDAPAQRSKPLPPVVFYVGAGLTAVATGLTIASGVDTLNAKSAFTMTPTNPLLDDGQSKESRTNALFWTTLGLGVTSAALAIFLVDWGRPKSSGVSHVTTALTPGAAVVTGIF